jgi:hypothetical protein
MAKDGSHIQYLLNETSEIITERLFTTRYLPLLLSEQPQDFIKLWVIEVSKSVNAKVRVINEFDGNLLFTVPPLFSTVVNSVAFDRIGVEISAIQTVEKFNHIQAGHMYEQILPLLINISTEENYEETVQSWKEIFDRYGVTYTVAPEKVAIEEVTEEDFEFPE